MTQIMIEQCKGKDITNVAASKLYDAGWVASIKYDGNYVQIHKLGDNVSFFTSGDKQFYIPEIADYLIENNPDNFILECEFIAETNGKLGSRVKCSTGTLRNEFEKGIKSSGIFKFMVFDILDYNGPIMDWNYIDRIALLTNGSLELHRHMHPAQILGAFLSLDRAKEIARMAVAQGYEGIYCKQSTHKYIPGKRVNEAIKIKFRPTADLRCIDVCDGEGKYSGLIGSLVLADKSGRTVQVGSGLSDWDRSQAPDYFLGKVVEIEYEQILDTYIQPTFVRIRDDKTIEEID